MTYSTEQESFWAGQFGNDYIERNTDTRWLAANTALFSSVIRRCEHLTSIMEFGANVGLNLRALKTLAPQAEFAAVEINAKAAQVLREQGGIDVYEQSVLEFQAPKRWDLVLSKGLLIHINPEHLASVYERLYQSAQRYICICEYYNPAPVEIPYRGHSGKLFKRDFAGDLLDRYGDLRLVDYQFVYRRDPNFAVDDLTWFLLEKRG